MMETYNFSWDQLGNVDEGRPNLGNTTKVAVYRLMQYTMRSVLEKEFGDERTRALLVKAGKLAGHEFCINLLDTSQSLNKFISQFHDKLLEYSVGILKVEKANTESFSFIVTVSEDLDCSGLPVKGVSVCDYDEGFIQGVFEAYLKKEFVVKEIDCWSTGERTCRFTIDLKS
jgi:uncharacterized protein